MSQLFIFTLIIYAIKQSYADRDLDWHECKPFKINDLKKSKLDLTQYDELYKIVKCIMNKLEMSRCEC